MKLRAWWHHYDWDIGVGLTLPAAHFGGWVFYLSLLIGTMCLEWGNFTEKWLEADAPVEWGYPPVIKRNE